jgi:hypothetical protein
MHPPPDERLSVYAFDDTVGLALLRIYAGLYSNQFSAVCPKYDNGTASDIPVAMLPSDLLVAHATVLRLTTSSRTMHPQAAEIAASPV